METKKIVMTSTFYPPFHLGGDAVHVRYLSEELVRRGHEVHVVHSLDAYDLKSRGKRPRAERTDVITHPVETPMGSAGAALSFLTGQNRAAERVLRKVVSEVRPDWVHHHNISLLGHGVLDIGKAPKLYTAHDHWLVCPRNDMMYLGKERCTSRDCTACSLRSGRPPQFWRTEGLRASVDALGGAIAPSQYMAGVLKKDVGLESTVLPNFVPRPPRVHGEDIPPHFMFAGVLEPHKGLDLLLRAYVRSEAAAELHVAGKGSLGPMVDEYSRRTGGKVRNLGFLSRDMLMPEVSSALCLASPSACLENSPLSCIEALSLGTPLLVSPNGGLPELVSGPCGLVADLDEDSLASALRMFEEQAELRSSLSFNALRRYEDVHTPELYIASYLQLAGALT